MQVYKNYFRILKSTGRVIVLYLAIFTAIIIVLSLFSQSDNAQSFTQSKLDTVFINHDEDSPLINSLYKNLEKTCNFRESTDDLNELKDAIFFGDISYVIIIPKGFTENFYNGKNPTLEKMSSGASTITDYVTIAINNYLSTANIFLKADPSISEDNLIKLVENSLDTDIPVTMNTGAEKSEGTSFMAQYFNYFVYILLSKIGRAHV
jgi:ABC-2 type transport system permease protein